MAGGMVSWFPMLEKNRKIAKGRHLMGDEIRPCSGKISGDVHRLAGQVQLRGRHHVFVEGVDGAKVAEVPVEFGAAVKDTSGDGRHHDVAAVS